MSSPARNRQKKFEKEMLIINRRRERLDNLQRDIEFLQKIKEDMHYIRAGMITFFTEESNYLTYLMTHSRNFNTLFAYEEDENFTQRNDVLKAFERMEEHLGKIIKITEFITEENKRYGLSDV